MNIEIKTMEKKDEECLMDLMYFFSERDIDTRHAAGLCGRFMTDLYKRHTTKENYIATLDKMKEMW
jgi:hypothetical protein